MRKSHAPNWIIPLEPTTGIGDGIETARATGTLRKLAPGETFTFWIALRVEA